jgi:glycosyltransferase involved in cell wall biosynthesis
LQVHQLLTSLTQRDAIGQNALYIQSLLRQRGFTTEIFAEGTDSAMAGLARPLEDYEAVSSPENVLLLHFSIGSKAMSLAHRVPDRLLLLYHNVTPAHFFLPHSPGVARQCLQGREELRRLVPRTSLALGVSKYNEAELKEMGFRRTGVLPYLFDPERLSRPPSPVVLELFDDEKTNFLFVGRVIPNKRFEDLLRVFKIYQSHIDRRSRLLLVGEWRDFESYYEKLVLFADELELRNVEFLGRVSTEELVACYRVADVFLSMSEHEGFCVPLLEAFQMGVPVIAYDAGAVSETLGGAGLLVHEKKLDEIAELAHLVVEDEALRESVLVGQDHVLDELLARDDSELLMRWVELA